MSDAIHINTCIVINKKILIITNKKYDTQW